MICYQGSEDFAFVKPNFAQKLDVPKSQQIDKFKYEIPKQYQNTNLFVQITSSAKNAHVTYFCTSLKVQIIENYGQVKVTDQSSKPLTKVMPSCRVRTSH